MPDRSVVRDKVQRHLEYAGADVDRANELYHDDAISYDGGPWQFGVQLLEFRDDKVARERIYVMEGWEAPEWRAPWRSDTPADPPE